jgi:hypothetical protein
MQGCPVCLISIDVLDRRVRSQPKRIASGCSSIHLAQGQRKDYSWSHFLSNGGQIESHAELEDLSSPKSLWSIQLEPLLRCPELSFVI